LEIIDEGDQLEIVETKKPNKKLMLKEHGISE
jgi:hypothetical protein